MRGRPTDSGPQARKVKEAPQSIFRRWMQLSLTGRMFLLVVIAVLPALVIQAVNEYALRTAREDEIRQRVIQITKQFGEEIQAIRAGASQLLVALGELDEVQKRDAKECGATFAKLKARFESYVRIGAADDAGNVFCSSGPIMEPSVAETEFFKRAITGDGLAVGNFFIDPDTGEKMIHFAERFEDANGKVAGVVFAGLDLEWLSEHLKERGLVADSSILIADRRGQHHRAAARTASASSARTCGSRMKTSWMAIRAGWEEAAGVDGAARIFGYVPPALPPKDFFLSAGQSKAEALSAIDSATRRGIGLILRAFWRRFTRPGSAAAISSAGRSRACSSVTAEWRNGQLRCPRQARGPLVGNRPSRDGLQRNGRRSGGAACGAAEGRGGAAPAERDARIRGSSSARSNWREPIAPSRSSWPI